MSYNLTYKFNYESVDKLHLYNKGFTLAEVLITLLIIGVISSIVIPGLISNTKEQEYRIALKKSYATISQVYLHVRKDNGGSMKGMCGTGDSNCFKNLFKPYLNSVFEVAGVPNSTGLPGCWGNNETIYPAEANSCIVLADGMSASFDMEYGDCNWNCGAINIDVNGLKKPNVWGKDRFLFRVYENKVAPEPGRTCLDGTGVYSSNLGCSLVYLAQ